MQSKLWFNDGIWWGSLYNAPSEQYEIFRYDAATHSWNTTGTVIDTRKVSRADCLWDGKNLYIASAVRLGSGISNKSIQILRFQYDPGEKRYTLDAGFPVLLTSQDTYGIVLDKDTTGVLWVTYTAPNGNGGSSVYISHSDVEGAQWTTPYVLPVTGASNLLVEDISSLVAYSGQIGLMWSNQNQHAIYFAKHIDGDPGDQWQGNTVLQGNLLSDNHIHLKAVQFSSDGRFYAAVKTSLNNVSNPNPDAPLLILLQINPDGSWTHRTFGRVSERHTRPLLLIDEENRALYFFATSFCCGNGKIYYKQIRLDDEEAQFSQGLGIPFLDFGEESNINNATSTKQTLNSKKDLLVVAEDSLGGSYVYNSIDLESVLDENALETKLIMPMVSWNNLQTP
jgi:hypothetical protein